MDQTPQTPKSKLLWSLLFLAIAAATIGAVASQSGALTLPAFLSYVSGLSAPWLAAAGAGMLGFVFFEGEAVLSVCRAFGYPTGHRRGFLYSASDIYFSAITPSATGGQPACAYFMVKDGIPVSVAAVALLVNLTMYTAAILTLGLGTLVLQPGIFLSFGPLSRLLIGLGFAAQTALAAVFLLLLTRGAVLHAICAKCLHLLCRLRLLKREEQKQQRLAEHMAEYARYAGMIGGHRGMLLRAFLCNLLQRASVISVSLCVFLAGGGAAGDAVRVWAVQCCAVIGSNTVPIPGAMGVSDYLMLDGFGSLMSPERVVNFELLSRSVSFYTCVLLCGAVTLAGWLRRRKRGGIA